jgi:hypothetical protein
MYGLRLPDLAPLVPMPVPPLTTAARYAYPTLGAEPAGSIRWTERLTDEVGTFPDWRDGRSVQLRPPGAGQVGFVEDPSRLWNGLRAAIGGGAPPDGPDILVGALAVPFWDPTGPTSPGGTDPTWEVLRGAWWFPAGWYHYLRTPVTDGGAGRPAEAVGVAAVAGPA